MDSIRGLQTDKNQSKASILHWNHRHGRNSGPAVREEQELEVLEEPEPEVQEELELLVVWIVRLLLSSSAIVKATGTAHGSPPSQRFKQDSVAGTVILIIIVKRPAIAAVTGVESGQRNR
jgi:hypothetical protein